MLKKRTKPATTGKYKVLPP
jgi:hypothetical protein